MGKNERSDIKYKSKDYHRGSSIRIKRWHRIHKKIRKNRKKKSD